MQACLARATLLREKYADLTTRRATPDGSAAAVSRIDPLTAREAEVATQVARGLSNREIAEALLITESTAEVHVKRILGKLHFKSWPQSATSATQRAFLPRG
jgi:DNA-binding NarL/FixJ family response regulator